MAESLAMRPQLADELAHIMAERKLATEGALSERDGEGFAERLNRTTRELVQRMRQFFKE